MDSFRGEQRILALRVDGGEHSFQGIPGVEACPGLGFNKEKLMLIFHGKAADITRKVLFWRF